jgi:hypothetical protein
MPQTGTRTDFAEIINDGYRRLGMKIAPLIALALMWLWLVVVLLLIGFDTSAFETLFGWDFLSHPFF